MRYEPDFRPTLILVGGPSGVGKTTIINELTRKPSGLYARPRSFTSRPRRDGEGNEEYEFVSDGRIRFLHRSGELLNLDQAYGNYYGISARSVSDLLSEGRIPIKEVHPENHGTLRTYYPSLQSVLLVGAGETGPMARNEIDMSPRHTEDDVFYSSLGTSQFDIIIRTGHDDLGVSSESLDIAIRAVLSSSHYFPRPQSIDAQNRAGYMQVSNEFFDERRITTRNFHELSISFFSREIRARIQAKSKCLELGPGRGWLRSSIAWPATDYISADITSAMSTREEPTKDTNTVVEASARSLPFESNCFDSVFASLADPFLYPAALCEMRRVLKPNGRFVFSVPTKTWSDAIRGQGMELMTTFNLVDGNAARVYSFTFDDKELRSLLSLCGWQIESLESATGSALEHSRFISPALSKAADHLGIGLDSLPILHLVTARKHPA